MRIFYLKREKRNPENASFLTWSLSTQEYKLTEEYHVSASAASMTLTFLSDLRATTVTHYHVMRLGFPFQLNEYAPYSFVGQDDENLWVLESIPRDPTKEATKVVSTTCRWGFFVNAFTEQCNIKNLVWDLSTDPVDAISAWPWSGYTVLRDSWAWVHGVHIFFAADALLNLTVLLTIVYRKAREGKFWLGDAFVSVASTLQLRALVILLTWGINGFWSVMEFCLKDSHDVADLPPLFVFEEIIHADLLTLYLGLAGLLGHLLRERIDPALVVILYEIGFQFRQQVARAIPFVLETTGAFAANDFMEGLVPMLPKHTALTPMRFWTAHNLGSKDPSFIVTALIPSFASFALVIAYVLIRKAYHHIFPPHTVVSSRTSATGSSTTETESLTWKSTLTMFEIATGAPLQHRVGLVSDYDNCVYIKGMKFASADGIYCNGFVIANKKWLVATDDLLSIFIMIVTRVRVRNVYAYEVDGHTVQHTARLVYPQTMTLKELCQLNITILT